MPWSRWCLVIIVTIINITTTNIIIITRSI